jgi:hypothetical protein
MIQTKVVMSVTHPKGIAKSTGRTRMTLRESRSYNAQPVAVGQVQPNGRTGSTAAVKVEY